MLGNHHRHIALLFVGFIGGVDQLYAVTLIKLARFVVVNVSQKRQMRFRIDRRRNGNRLAAAARHGLQTGIIEHFSRFTAQLVQQAVWYKQRARQVNLDVARIVKGLAKLRHAIAQVRQRFLRLGRLGKLAVQRVGDADALFAGHRQDQLLLPAAQLDIDGDAALAGGFQQRLLPVMIEVSV